MAVLPMRVSLQVHHARYLLLGSLLLAVAVPAVQAQVALTSTQPLAFGSFVAGNGSVSVDPAGMRTTTGEVVALSADPGQAAQFVVTGDPSMTYAITLPADGVVTLNNGTSSMPVNGFTSNPAGSGVLSGSGSQALSVGATLGISAGQPPGSYSGSFDVTVNYN